MKLRATPAIRLTTLPATGVTLGWLLFFSVANLRAQVCSDCHDTDRAAFEATVHGAFECTDCHAQAAEVPHGEGVRDVDCSTCHGSTVEEYRLSIHGLAVGRGEAEAPTCASCHGQVHRLVPVESADSPVSAARVARTCGECHSRPGMSEKFGILVARPVEAYEGSVHARALRDTGTGPSCGSCHGTHDIRPASDPLSRVHHQRVPDTCGECHQEIARAYGDSVHGKAARHGAREAPVCTDCHGEHRILSPEEPGSPVYAANVPRMTCGRCHSDLRLTEKYGLRENAVRSHEDSYHGLASRAGTLTVANCASCHGVHDILPSSDPASHVHEDNLAATCGQCHPGAGTRFAIGPVHVLAKDRAPTASFWVRRVYLWLIFLTIGAMVVHNLLDLFRKAREGRPVPPPSTRAPERMGRGFRIAHGVLAASFVVLAYTGFALKYPEAWWAAPLLRFEVNFGLRGWLHRVAAIVLIGSLVFHLVHLAFDRRARACIAAMRPGLADLRELGGRLRYFVGLSQRPPHSPALGYAEKIEYLALMWGIIVMAVTGFALWFDDFMLAWLPKWAIDVATVIHFYEAVLATLAILVWHFYFVIFDPVVYPMDPAWLTGRSAPGRDLERGVGEPPVAGGAPSPPPRGET